MKDIFDRIKKDKGPLGNWAKQAEGYFVFPKLEGQISSEMRFKGEKVITWSINDYLGLANHPEVRKADNEAVAEYGLAYPMGARMMSGHTMFHEELEQNLARFEQKEAAYLLNFGYQGMVSGIEALVTRNDVIVYDAESHACIIDGVRLHQGKRFAYKHNDVDSLEVNLQRATKLIDETGGGILVVSEGVFGMRGVQGKLKEIVRLKKKYKFRFLIDDAHGFGVLGKNGAGASEEQGVMEGIDIYFAAFAKSMAGIGGFFAADADIINFMKYNMRSQMFAKSLPMAMVKGALKRLEMISTMPELKSKLWKQTLKLQNGLKEEGFDIGNTNSCITPVFLQGSIPEAMHLVYDLRENYRIFCSIVVYPVIPKDLIMLRLIPTAAHKDDDIEKTIDAFSTIRENLELGLYRTKKLSSLKNSY
ncbi:aminotransferase class I/II-fold pyridoxal phosphate-dependent enzyme [Flavivirga jejuensis]|uniref:Pyridoxal phosphate-dependent aminotransferase family protein n=1 Tax=Flavivirga jejuensis TaxID=870487 RepID=A0ABT8WT66_9FLAO|nr:pyridoxal phosphate-dependent aminotransferase family protein [Flavivirga jejuensis]MDO5976350.1 pyridoxal phosphate-dependent aminotransferase family protein [Flavivirga jejuensis]